MKCVVICLCVVLIVTPGFAQWFIQDTLPDQIHPIEEVDELVFFNVGISTRTTGLGYFQSTDSDPNFASAQDLFTREDQQWVTCDQYSMLEGGYWSEEITYDPEDAEGTTGDAWQESPESGHTHDHYVVVLEDSYQSWYDRDTQRGGVEVRDTE